MTFERNDRHPGSLDRQGQAIVERLGGAWRPGGGMCHCPAHDDRSPSLSVRVGERRLLFHCFAGCETDHVLRSLAGLHLLDPRRPPGAWHPRDASHDGRRHRGAAERLWAAARPIGNSPAERYLRGRGLTIPVLDLRYLAQTPCGRGAEAVFRPALLAAVREASQLVAVHRTFLDPVSARIADLPLPKRALGPLGGGAVQLGSPDRGLLGWAEGIETAIAASVLTGIPCWATLGTGRFARVTLPDCVKRLVLFLDNDPAGRRAEKLARRACSRAALEIEARYPQAAGSDWNDVLLGDDAP